MPQKTPKKISITSSQYKDKAQLGKGLDVGTAFIYAAWQENREVCFQTQRDAFLDIPYSDHIKALIEREGMPFVERESKLYVIGESALRLANLFKRTVRRPLACGVINPKEHEALLFISLMLENILGVHRERGEAVYYSVPASPVDTVFDVEYHKRVVNSILSGFGYTPKPINEGLAVIFSELPKENFTGLAFSFGAGMTNVCFANLSVPVATFSIGQGGDWIDRRVAEVIDEPVSNVTTWKESSLDLTKPQTSFTRIEQAFSIYYDILLDYVIEHLNHALLEAHVYVENPIKAVVSGGTAMPLGFLPRLQERLERAQLPFEISEVRLAKEPLHTVAKGALIAAIADERNKEIRQ